MCGRAYETYTDQELYFRYLSKQPITEFSFQPIYNLCPTMNSPVLRLIAAERRFDQMHWQLIPNREPTFKTSLSTINAKSETVFRSPLYRDLVVRQRCIIPLSGFFEWKRDYGRKRPFKIHLRDEPIMSVAGIWDTWRRGTPDERCSFSILTTAANSFMSTIHDRMPVILGRSDEDAWLDPEIHEQEELQKLFKPCPSSWLTAVESQRSSTLRRTIHRQSWSQRAESATGECRCSSTGKSLFAASEGLIMGSGLVKRGSINENENLLFGGGIEEVARHREGILPFRNSLLRIDIIHLSERLLGT